MILITRYIINTMKKQNKSITGVSFLKYLEFRNALFILLYKLFFLIGLMAKSLPGVLNKVIRTFYTVFRGLINIVCEILLLPVPP
jgi:hypothetical protein